MSERAEIPAVVDFAPPGRELSGEERLAAYLAGPYSRQREDVARRFNALRGNPSRRLIFDLSVDALYFLGELAYWKRVATDLHEVKMGEELRRARDNAASAQESGPGSRSATKRPAKEVEAEARQHARSYRSALALISDTRSDLERIISWAQTMLKEMRDEEFSGEGAGAPMDENDRFAERSVDLS